jgi:hypothetical protein
VGRKDEDIGDPGFDQRIGIRSQPRDAASRLLADLALRQRALALKKRDEITLKGEELKLVLRGMELREQ